MDRKAKEFERQLTEMQAAHALAAAKSEDRALALQEEAARLRELAGQWHARNLDLEYQAAARRNRPRTQGEAARLRTAMQVVLEDHRQMECKIEELERSRRELEGEIADVRQQTLDLNSEKHALHAQLVTLREEHSALRRLAASVGQSPFTRVLCASGIWKVRFPEE